MSSTSIKKFYECRATSSLSKVYHRFFRVSLDEGISDKGFSCGGSFLDKLNDVLEVILVPWLHFAADTKQFR